MVVGVYKIVNRNGHRVLRRRFFTLDGAFRAAEKAILTRDDPLYLRYGVETVHVFQSDRQ